MAARTFVARMCAEDAGRAAALDVNEAVARQTNADVDVTSPGTVLSLQIEARFCVLLVTATIITLVISNAPNLRLNLEQLFKCMLNFRMATKTETSGKLGELNQ